VGLFGFDAVAELAQTMPRSVRHSLRRASRARQNRGGSPAANSTTTAATIPAINLRRVDRACACSASPWCSLPGRALSACVGCMPC